MRLLLLCLLGLCLAAPIAHAQASGGASAGTVSVSVPLLAPLGVGARVWVAEGVAVGAVFDRSAFELAGLGADRDPFFDPDPEAWTLAVQLESGGSRGRLEFATGGQVFVQRQVDDVYVGGRPETSVWEDGRRVAAVGAGVLLRTAVRVVGPVSAGVESGLGLRRVWTQGGTEERDGATILYTLDDTRSRWAFGGPVRLYVAVRW
ncbi:hypothetical protein [Rubrivirga sp. IMCC43871]|uniref:hypothetical protein n=1 Tax=Rubrivirga sp. IMCC43871 TaxID=3391575 RepID=UPI00399029CC